MYTSWFDSNLDIIKENDNIRLIYSESTQTGIMPYDSFNSNKLGKVNSRMKRGLGIESRFKTIVSSLEEYLIGNFNAEKIQQFKTEPLYKILESLIKVKSPKFTSKNKQKNRHYNFEIEVMLPKETDTMVALEITQFFQNFRYQNLNLYGLQDKVDAYNASL